MTEPSSDVVVFAEKDYEIKALNKAQNLRNSGKTVEISLFDTIEETKKYAEEKNIPSVISVGESITEVK